MERKPNIKYVGCHVDFLNIKLSNDKFFYTPDYVDISATVPDALVQRLDAVTFVSMVMEEVSKCGFISLGMPIPLSFSSSPSASTCRCLAVFWITFNTCLENLREVEVKYFLEEQRLALYFWNLDGSFCMTVKFEYGFHEGAKR